MSPVMTAPPPVSVPAAAPAILNTKGAAALLGCKENWIHKLVYRQRLPAYVYTEGGRLEPRPPGYQRQGAGLYFMESDILAYRNSPQRKKGHPFTKNLPLGTEQ